jgi:hypothetical protein
MNQELSYSVEPDDAENSVNFSFHSCHRCGDHVTRARWGLGYRLCKLCGNEQAQEERQHWTVAPMHKSNYMLITNHADLLGINNKGGLVK